MRSSWRRGASLKPFSDCRAVVLGGGAIGLGAALVLAAHGTKEIHIAETNSRRHGPLREAGSFAVYDPTTDKGPAAGTAHIVVDAFGVGRDPQGRKRSGLPGRRHRTHRARRS